MPTLLGGQLFANHGTLGLPFTPGGPSHWVTEKDTFSLGTETKTEVHQQQRKESSQTLAEERAYGKSIFAEHKCVPPSLQRMKEGAKFCMSQPMGFEVESRADSDGSLSEDLSLVVTVWGEV